MRHYSEKLLSNLCNAYMFRLDLPEHERRSFGGATEIHQVLLPEMSIQQIDEACRELDRAGFLSCFYADNTVAETYLLDAGLQHKHDTAKNTLLSILKFFKK